MYGQQTTSKEGYPKEVSVEHSGNLEVLNISTVLKRKGKKKKRKRCNKIF
jgi:hypothetical protein